MQLPVFLGVVLLLTTVCSNASPLTLPNTIHQGRASGKYLLPRQTNDSLQTVVEWDEHSLFINGERIMIWSGEVHPWRLPVPSLWLDIFQKVKALGFNTVSFYVHWGLVESAKDDFSFESWRSYDPFFAAAKEAGIYLMARPGPYINAETTAGGFPGWGQRVKGAWRSDNETYLDAIAGYVSTIGKIIAANQITEGGPIILLQPENEFSGPDNIPWPQSTYMQLLEDGFRDAGVTIPTILNDVNVASDNYVPGSGEGAVDIYGYDSYPQGFDCANPTTWNTGAIPTNFWQEHIEESPSTQNAIMEFQAGAFDPWGGSTYNNCAILLNNEFERVFYKNLMSFSTTLMNMYMVFGGTNWGGIPHPGVYTSYDYGSPIDESRTVTREKYSELKLEANFLMVSPAYLTSQPLNLIPSTITGAFTNTSALAVTQVADVVGNKTVFWILRHSDYTSRDTTPYKLTIPTSKGNVTIPQLQGALTLDGRDSKVHLSDYAFGNKTILYSSGEVLTWKVFGSKTVILLYGSPGETHETAFLTTGSPNVTTLSGTSLVTSSSSSGSTILNYETSGQTVVQIGSDLLVYLLDRNTAYNFWVPHLPGSGNFSSYSTENSVIVKGAYLIRSASVSGSTLSLLGDLNATSTIEVLAGDGVTDVEFNGEKLTVTSTPYGALSGQASFVLPNFTLPELAGLTWKVADSLPEIQANYSDSLWPVANITVTPNTFRNLTTPVSLYSGDYGFHTGNILFRGHFTASGAESTLNLTVQGGSAFGFSVWLNSDFIASFPGIDASSVTTKQLNLPSLAAGSSNTITVLQDHQGYEEDGDGGDEFKAPRGILDYSFAGNASTSVSWKLTGNLGGEHYVDRIRGPLNEGGLYAERQGWHLPGFDTSSWETASPLEGVSAAGVSFFKTDFDLSLPTGYDIPLAFVITNTTEPSNFRAQLYVNGYRYGKYENNVGPQKEFPVPEGILNYRGSNSLGISLWAMDAEGAKLGGLALVPKVVVKTSYPEVEPTEQPPWTARPGAY